MAFNKNMSVCTSQSHFLFKALEKEKQMKKVLRLTFVVFCLLTHSLPSRAQWIQTNGPYGGKVNSLAAVGGNIAAGVYGAGLYLSTNNGTSWSSISRDITPNAFVVSGGNLFAGDGGVFLSTDSGMTWNHANEGMGTSSIFALALSGSDLFAGGIDGLYLSTDNASSWTAVDSGLTTKWVTALAVVGTNIFAGTRDAGVFRSTDNGSSWHEANSGLSNLYINCLATVGTDLFTGGQAEGGGGIFRSTDNGSTWTPASMDVGVVQALLAVPDGAGGTNLLAGMNSQGIFLSTDKGSSWVDLNTSFTRLVWALAVSPSASGLNLFAGTSAGVALSTDKGSHWTLINDGINACYITCLMKSDSDLFAGTGGSGVFLSTDNGASWNLPGGDSPVNSSIVSALGKAGPNLVVGTLGIGDYVSTDNGSTWTTILPGLTGYTFATFPSPDGSGMSLFAGTQAGVSVSTDNGLHWVNPSDRLTDSSGVYMLVVSLAEIDTTLFAGTLSNSGDGGSLLRSTDNGASWTESNTGLPYAEVEALAVCNGSLFAGTWAKGIYVSTDKGSTWTQSGLPDIDVPALLVAGTNIFAGTWGHGVFLSTDNGSSWSSVDSLLTNNYVSSLAINGGYLFIGTVGSYNGFGTLSSTNNAFESGNGIYSASTLKKAKLVVGRRNSAPPENNSNWTGTVWRRPLSEMITPVKDKHDNMPASIALDQNYPNPFNPTTTISYQLSAVSNVTLKIFDVLGREVETLVSGRQTAGVHTVTFDAGNLSSGVYFYRLEAGAYHDTKKLLILK